MPAPPPRGSCSPSSIRRSSASTALRPRSSSRSMYSIPSRWSVSCWKIRASRPSPTISSGLPFDVLPAARGSAADRGVGWYGPGIDRQPSSSVDLALGVVQLGVRHERAARVSPSSNTNSRSEIPTCGAGEPDARRRVHRLDHVLRRACAASGRTARPASPARAGRGRRACGWAAIMSRSSSQVRLGLDALDDPRGGEVAHRAPERGDPSGLEREQAYRPASERRDQRRDRLVLRPAPPRAPAVPITRNTGAPTGNPGRRASLPLAREEPIGVARARAPGPRDPTGASSARSHAPAGRAQPTASIQIASARSRAASPGRRGRRVGVEHRDEVQAADAEVAHGLGPADRRSRPPASGSRGRVTPRDRHRGAPRRPTPRRARRRRGGSRRSTPPQTAQRPGASQTTHRTCPASSAEHAAARGARGRARRRCGRPARRRSREPARTRTPAAPCRSAWTSAGRPPFGARAGPPPPSATAARRASTTGQAERRGLARRAERPRARTRAADSRARCERDVADVVVGRAVLSMRGVRLTRHVDQPDVPERREHRGPRPDDDVVARRRAIVEPRPVPRAACRRPTNTQTPLPERRPRSAAAVAGTGDASGTTTIARRPPRAGTHRPLDGERACSSSGAGRTTNAPDPAADRVRGELGPTVDSPRAGREPAARPPAGGRRGGPRPRGASQSSSLGDPRRRQRPEHRRRAARRIARPSTARARASRRRRTGPARHAASPEHPRAGRRRSGPSTQPASACRGTGSGRTSRHPRRARPAAS